MKYYFDVFFIVMKSLFIVLYCILIIIIILYLVNYNLPERKKKYYIENP